MHEDPLIVHLTIDGELIETTPEHPFRLANGEWVPAAALEIGAQIQRANGTTDIVEAIEFSYDSQLMYNLTVATAHTFFVGNGQWLVHNCTPPKYVIHYTSANNYRSIANDGFKLEPSPAEGTFVDQAPSGVFFGDADPPMPGHPYSTHTIKARWGVPNNNPDHFILIDTTKLSASTIWASREWPWSPGRPEWVLATSEPVDVSSAVVNHGHINLLNK